MFRPQIKRVFTSRSKTDEKHFRHRHCGYTVGVSRILGPEAAADSAGLAGAVSDGTTVIAAADAVGLAVVLSGGAVVPAFPAAAFLNKPRVCEGESATAVRLWPTQVQTDGRGCNYSWEQILCGIATAA